jgi:hypothetical protein
VCLRKGSLTNPACNAPPYCHLRSLYLNQIFRYYLINGTIFKKNVVEGEMCILIFSATFIEILLPLNIIQQDIVKMRKSFLVKYPLSFSDFN